SGLDIPHWILSWHTIMLGAGLWLGYRKNYQGSSWLALTVIGAIFTLKHIVVFDFEISRITAALAFIGVGLYLILKPKRLKSVNDYTQKKTADFSDVNS
ncbi:MAG: hypothetical protein EOO95_13020, partial [Pedobacter sp.]